MLPYPTLVRDKRIPTHYSPLKKLQDNMRRKIYGEALTEINLLTDLATPLLSKSLPHQRNLEEGNRTRKKSNSIGERKNSSNQFVDYPNKGHSSPPLKTQSK